MIKPNLKLITLLLSFFISGVLNAQSDTTGNVAFGGIASASDTYSSNSAEEAFDGDTTYTGWGNAGDGLPSWLEYNFGPGNAKVLRRYAIISSSQMTGGWGSTDYVATAWTFEGFNGTSWDTLDIQSNITPVQDEWGVYSFPNTTAYQRYRIVMTSSEDGDYVTITEMRLYLTPDGCLDAALPVNTTSISNMLICNSGSTTLSATVNGNASWYNSATGGNYLGAGTNFTTPNISTTTTYYIQDSTSCDIQRLAIKVLKTTSMNPSVVIEIDSTYGIGANVAFGGIASASDTYSSNSAQAAFDGDSVTTGWGNNGDGFPSWLEYDFGVGNEKTLVKYAFISSSEMVGGWGSTSYVATAWTFEGFNGTTWDTLDIQSDIIAEQDVWAEYTFTNTTAYQKYRINFTESEGGSYATVTEMRLHEAVLNPCSNLALNSVVTANPGNISYQWKLNGDNVGNDENFLILTDFNQADIVTCFVTSDNTCIVNSNTTSNVFTIQTGVPNTFTTVTGSTISVDSTDATYQWIDCDSNTPIADETKHYFTSTQDGNFAVIVSNTCGVDTSECKSITIGKVKDNTLNSNLKVYPNPTSNDIFIELGEIYAFVSITVSDITGRIISTKELTNISNTKLSLDVNPGIYFIEISNGIDNKVVKKIIKN